MAASGQQSMSSGLAERSITAVLWGALGTVLKGAVQLLAQIALARILGPEQYGLFAAGLAIFLFSSFFADVGLSYGLIQKKTVTDLDIRFVFTWQTILGIGVTLALFTLAPWVASLFGDERLVLVIRLLSLTCVINSLRATSNALLNRRLDFKTLNMSSLTSYSAGFLLVGIPLALAGAQVESLVAAFMTEALVGLLIQYSRCRHPVRPLFWAPDSDGILQFGFVVLITNLLNWVMSSMDRMVIGRMFSMTQVGLYSTAYNVITMPAMQAQALLQSVLYSASSQVQDDKARLRTGFRTMFGMVALFFLPMFTGVSAVSHTVIAVLYGHKWVESAPLLGVLALAMPFYLMMGMAIPCLWAGGKTTLEFKLQIPVAILWVVTLIFVASTGSLVALAWAVCGLFVLRAAVLIGAALHVVDVSVGACFRQLAVGVAASAVVVPVIWFVDQEAHRITGIPVLCLFADITAGAAALLLAVRLLRTHIDPAVGDLVFRLMGRLPGSVGLRAHRALLGAHTKWSN